MIENEAAINAVKETVKEIALLLGGANIILVALITWMGKVWMDKLVESERRKTLMLVEQLKDSLTQERDRSNQVLKTQLDQSRFFFEKTISFLSDNQKIIGEKRLLAFEKLWKTIYELKKIAPFYLDIISPTEQELIRTNPYFKSTIKNIDEQQLLIKYQSISSEFESLRIYIPMIIWQLYSSYKILSVGIQFRLKIFQDSSPNEPIIPWYQQNAFRDIIVNVIDDEQIKEFDSIQNGQLFYILDILDSKLLELMQRDIAGDIALETLSSQVDLLSKANQRAQGILNESGK